MAERLRFERELNDLGLREYDQGQVSSKPRSVVVGERVVLDLDKTDFAGKVSTVRWTIPDTVVRTYDGTTSNARTFDLTDTDLGQPKISFFWVDAGDGRMVMATILLNSGAMVPFITFFDVKGPKLDGFTASTGVTQIEKRGGLTAMRFGSLTGPTPPKKPEDRRGIQWDWQVTMPANRAGFVKDVQTVRNDRWKLLRPRSGETNTRKMVWRHPRKTAPHVQLDGHDGSEPAYRGGLFKVKTRAGKSITLNTISDSPHVELEKLATVVSVNDQFTYFIMFKPETPKPSDAIWVPVARATWSWKATAKNVGGRWPLDRAEMKPTFDKTTTDFPIYESNAFENKWQEVPP